MKHLSTVFILLIYFLPVQDTFGQNFYCNKSKISQEDKKLIEQFWTDFKKAVNAKDQHELVSVIQFPFNCDYCILDSSKDNSYDNLKVTKKLFDKKQYKIFFDEKLSKTISNYLNLFNILSIMIDDTKKHCTLNFSYASVEPSKHGEGQQHFFTIKKNNGKFLITSAWTVP